MTKAQRRALAMMAEVSSVHGADLHAATRQALRALGYIEECPRLFYGPRDWRFRLTAAGRAEAKKQGPVGPTRFERKPPV